MIELEKLNYYFNLFKNITLEDAKDIFSSVTKKRLNPHDFFIEAGSKKRQLAYIKSGLIRAFLLTEKGEEITILVRWEDQFVASPDIILHNRPSRFFYQALELTELLVIDYDITQKILRRNPKFEQVRKHFLLSILKESIERVESFVLLSPEERYLDFIKKKPTIANRIPDKYIATILGITPVSLSRIRKRIAEREQK